MRLLDDDLVELQANFSVEDEADDRFGLVLESHSGPRQDRPAKNEDYIPVLRLLLERLRTLRAVIEDGRVDSTRAQRLPLPERRLQLRNRTYPLLLSDETDIEDLRLAIMYASGKVGTQPGNKPGNTRKRIRFTLTVPGFSDGDGRALAARLVRPISGQGPDIRLLDPAAGVPVIAVSGPFHLRPVEVPRTSETSYDRSARTVLVQRTEGALVHAYLRWVGGSEPATRSVSSAGVTDIFSPGNQGAEIVEAKSTARHQHVRMALGQLLDYADSAELPISRLTALLPERPAKRDIELLHTYGIDCVIPEGAGFTRCEANEERRAVMMSIWNSPQLGFADVRSSDYGGQR